MATLALGAIGSAIGGAVLPGGVSILGTALSGAALGGAVGAVAGAFVDQSLFAGSGQETAREGPRLSDLKVSGSTEGAAIPRVYGRMRVPGQLIWATNFEEDIVVTSQTQSAESGGKGFGGGLFGGGGGGQQQTTQTTEYRYFANLAYAVAEGEITRVGRIWADGKELDQGAFTIRVHTGSEIQTADSLIEAKEGAGNAPAYRGTAYVVFERMALARFGNRIPQLNFEVFRAVDSFEKTVKGINIIPSAGEFVYEQDPIVRVEDGASVTENQHTPQGGTDWTVSIDQLDAQLPNVSTASLVVAWFGDDLRIGTCTLRPKVEVSTKTTQPDTWSAGGVTRSSAQVVSQVSGGPAFGGTPSDKSVVSAIQDLKSRGYKVSFYPFILMDIANGNTLPDPYSDNAGTIGQPVYPWRGRITVSPAAGFVGTVDKTAAAATQVASFVGTAAVSDFAINGETVTYSGPAEWTLRRMILHYAHLCKAAGGVDAFLIASELKAATQVRESASSYPLVDDLVTLAADVSSVLGVGTKVSYAADWSEYFGHQPTDGSNDVYFHLDPLWSASDIDAVCIDNYWPLADWRDGDAHLDKVAGAQSIYELSYLKGNVDGGEGYDFFYASDADRDAQTRTTITDGLGKPWVFRFKDIKSWWQNQHFDRPGGTESATATAWVPESKPFWFTELGCPAIDKGANQPNVFIDPKSSESRAPYFSRSTRDDLIQRRYIQAFLEFFDPTHADYVSGSNPVSSVYADRMVDLERIYLWTWDARPYPAFPFLTDVWSDGGNWELGHWLTGRMAGGPLAAVVAQIMADHGFTAFSVGGLTGNMDGFIIDRIMPVRDALQTLELAFFFDAHESGGLIKFAHRGRTGVLATLIPDDLVETGADADLYTLTRGQETELPLAAKLRYVDANVDYRQAVAEARRLAVHSGRVATADIAVAIGQSQAQQIAESWLQDAWAARERARFALPPSQFRFEPTDLVTLQTDARDFVLRLTETGDGPAKSVEARSIEPDVFEALRTPQRTTAPQTPPVFGPAVAAFMDLPMLRDDQVAEAGFLAGYQSPWPGAVAFFRSPAETGFVLNTLAAAPATIGVTQFDFFAGPTARYDRGNLVRVKLDHGALASIDDITLLNGGNVAAVENEDGAWEIFQFRDAALVSEGVYDLSFLLRGQAGSERAMRDPVVAGARFVLVDSAVVQANMAAADIGLAYNWKFGPAGRGIGESSFTDRTHTFIGRALKPLSPIHVRGVRTGQDLDISWVRRTRIGGDGWDAVEVPLGEDSEAYEVDVLDGSSVVRTLAAASPAATYTEAQQVADFGAAQSAVDVKVYQLSAAYGRGIARDATL